MTPGWFALVVAGIIVLALGYLPILPASWQPFTRFVGGALVVLGVLVLVLGILGVGLVP